MFGEQRGQALERLRGNPELRDRLRMLIADPARARTMGARARELALERYSAERMTDDYLLLYERAMREQRR